MARHHRRTTVLAALAVLAAWLLVACGDDGNGQEPQELRREPVGYTGEQPFTPPVGDDEPVTPPPEPGGTVSSAAPGLYGGTRDEASCDPQAMVDYLASHPDRAEAWASVLDLSVVEIDAYVAELTPVLLRSDTVVTNHGFAEGEAVSIPAVLQAGTAVLVDRTGTPVTKCACGNPLTAPPPDGEVTFYGAEWNHFSVDAVTTVESSTTVVTGITLVEVSSGDFIVRPAGSEGDQDAPAPEPPDEDPLAPDTPSPTAETTTPTPTTPEETTPDETTPEETTPDETTTPEETTPGETTPPEEGEEATPTDTPGSPTTESPSPTVESPSPTGDEDDPGLRQEETPPTEDGDGAEASWVVGGCAAEDGTLTGTLRVRNLDDEPHTYEVTVAFGPGGEYGEATVSTPEVAPDETISQSVGTSASGDVPDGPVDCRITSIQDERGETPEEGPPLAPPPDATVSPEETTPTETTPRDDDTPTPSPTPEDEQPSPDAEDEQPTPDEEQQPQDEEDPPLDEQPSPTG